MKLNNLILVCCLSFITFSYAQKEKIIGEWLLTKVEVNDKVHEPFYITDLKQNGQMEVMGMKAGTWEFDKKANKIVMKSKLDKDFNGDNTIISISNKELVVVKDGAKLFYTKVSQAEIEKENATSALVGEWKLQNELGKTQLLKIELPNTFMFVEISSGHTTKKTGTWMYNSKEKSVIFIGRTRIFDGKNKVNGLTENKFVIENNGSKVIGKKSTSKNSIERLTFVYDDFPEESIDESPWTDFDALLKELSNVKYLKYRQGRLINGTQSFYYNTLMSKIEMNSGERRISFNNLSISINDTIQYSESVKGYLYNEYNNFFPREEPGPFRMVKTEEITVPAGTFSCKIFEGFEEDAKIKYWMIIDKPGVYAKIIREDVDPFDELEYTIIELEEIK
jgi:hypothetical protein